jgi:hypothetical protein
MKRYQRSSVKSEAQRKREATEKAARALKKTKQRLGIGRAQPLKGATPSPLVTKGWERKPRAAPTSDRIPGSAPKKDLIHAHKWKRGAEETASTVNEIRKKASITREPSNISLQQAFLGASPRRENGLKRNHAVNPMLRHHHCLVLVESSDLTVTKDRKIGCAGINPNPPPRRRAP